MPDQMALGAPTLRIRDSESELAFYQNDLGLKAGRKYLDPADGLEVTELGFEQNPRGGSEPILILKNDSNARKVPLDFAGLYHYAVLVPDRRSLASTCLAIGNSGAVYDGFADHTVSESLYLHDRERNGIEIYSDRPRNTWSAFKEAMNGGGANDEYSFAMLNKPLDFDSLLRELSKDERANPSPFPKGARIGHIHLRVTNLERSVGFYQDRLGLDIIGNLPGIGAAFLSAGGYHHHIGLNTWHSLGGSPHKDGVAGLENFTIVVPDGSTLKALAARFPDSPERDGRLTIADPDGIRIQVEVRHH